MFANYGLDDNPFGGRFAKPLKCPDEEKYFIAVDGFKNQKPVIDELFNHPADKISSVLISGSSGTGRSSVANYVVDKFRHHGAPLRVLKEISDDNFKNAIHTWFSELRSAVRRERIEFDDDLKIRLEALKVQIPFLNDDSSEYRDIVADAIIAINAKKRSLVCVFDRVVNHKIFALANDVFGGLGDESSLLVIFTTADARIEDEFRLSKLPNRTLISLDTLSGKDVAELVDQRWRQLLPGMDHPFDKNSIEKVFSFEKYPMSRALSALEFILKEKIDSIKGSNSKWPDPSLIINETEIAYAMINFIQSVRR